MKRGSNKANGNSEGAADIKGSSAGYQFLLFAIRDHPRKSTVSFFGFR
jgi:hypothetical protein